MEQRLGDLIRSQFEQYSMPIKARTRANTAALRAVDIELEKMADRLERLQSQRTAAAVPKITRVRLSIPGMTQVEQDVVSALFNLGTDKRIAEEATRSASKQVPGNPTFEVLVRKALDIARAVPCRR